jgi:hypothetical protein
VTTFAGNPAARAVTAPITSNAITPANPRATEFLPAEIIPAAIIPAGDRRVDSMDFATRLAVVSLV